MTLIKTIMFYSHYDVQPASIQDGWDTEPFDLIEKSDGYVYARGASDDKGPITATYFAMKELLETTSDIPVNIAILYEGEEESSSHGFEKQYTKINHIFLILMVFLYWIHHGSQIIDHH